MLLTIVELWVLSAGEAWKILGEKTFTQNSVADSPSPQMYSRGHQGAVVSPSNVGGRGQRTGNSYLSPSHTPKATKPSEMNRQCQHWGMLQLTIYSCTIQQVLWVGSGGKDQCSLKKM